MANKNGDDLTPDETPGYKPPEQKTLEQIMKSDENDDSLKKYKESLLGSNNPLNVEVFPNDSRKVIVSKLSLVVNGRPDIEIDLTGNLEEIKKKTFILKEGCQYKVKISFFVQREIVQGLKYVQSLSKSAIPAGKNTFMVGSYGPKKEIQSYTTPVDDAPSGMMLRGVYKVKSLFTDDDKNEHLKWEWKIEIKKDWE